MSRRAFRRACCCHEVNKCLWLHALLFAGLLGPAVLPVSCSVCMSPHSLKTECLLTNPSHQSLSSSQNWLRQIRCLEHLMQALHRLQLVGQVVRVDLGREVPPHRVARPARFFRSQRASRQSRPPSSRRKLQDPCRERASVCVVGIVYAQL